MAVAFSFAAICVAVRQIAGGVFPSVSDVLAEVRERTGPFLRISLLLFVLLLAALAATFWLSDHILSVLYELHVRPSGFAIYLLAGGLWVSALLVFSRLVLAIPAVILDNCRVVQAMFRSDELTEGKWLTLAVLLAEAWLGGYLAGRSPFWLASWIPANISLPSWFPWVLTAASNAGVIVVEATMFVGFAILYLRMSAICTSSEELATPMTQNLQR